MCVPPRRSPGLWLVLPVLALALGLSACSAVETPLPPTQPAQLACTYHGLPQPNGQIQAGFSCEVTGATSAESGFTVVDSVSGAVCRGPVRQGAGSCEVEFITSTTAGEPGTMAGELLPSHRRLGPVSPALAP
jgi:hypothetical protein